MYVYHVYVDTASVGDMHLPVVAVPRDGEGIEREYSGLLSGLGTGCAWLAVNGQKI